MTKQDLLNDLKQRVDLLETALNEADQPLLMLHARDVKTTIKFLIQHIKAEQHPAPPSEQLAAIVGPQLMQCITQALGGRTVYIPSTPQAEPHMEPAAPVDHYGFGDGLTIGEYRTQAADGPAPITDEAATPPLWPQLTPEQLRTPPAIETVQRLLSGCSPSSLPETPHAICPPDSAESSACSHPEVAAAIAQWTPPSEQTEQPPCHD